MRALSGLTRRWPAAVTVLTGVAVGAVCGLAVAGAGVAGSSAASAVPVAYGVATGAAVAARRRHPVGAVAVSAAAVAVAAGYGTFVSPVALLGVALCWYTAARHALNAHRAAELAAAVLFAQTIATAFAPHKHFTSIVLTAVVLGVLWLLVENARVRRAYVASLEQRSRQLEQQKADEGRRAAAQERTRIARELHDVVAHHVGVVAIQAGAARTSAQMGSTNASTSLAALVAIESAARSALTELSQIVGVLRSDCPAELEPQPQLEDLPRLVAALQRSGAVVHLRVDGELRLLPAVVELSAYRIAQEALTNVLKHTAQATATVVVSYEPRAVIVRVTDTGPALRSAAEGGAGHGILGMTERAAAAGGTVSAGPLPDGGFEVVAVLPAPSDDLLSETRHVEAADVPSSTP